MDEVREQLEWDLDWYQKNVELGTWAIIQKETGRIVGLCSLMPWTVDGIEEVEMSYILSEDCRGQGLGTELSRAVIRYGFEKLSSDSHHQPDRAGEHAVHGMSWRKLE